MVTYSVLEASELLKISARAVQKRCKSEDVRKKDNKYLITDEIIEKWKTKIKSNEPQTNQTNEPIKEVRRNELNLIKSLEEQIVVLQYEKEELKEELQQYEIGENERLEVFTKENYLIFETRLREWQSLQININHKEQLFQAETKGLNEMIEHYKNQFEYQKAQSDRILDIHEKLIRSVQQRNFIEAKTLNLDKE